MFTHLDMDSFFDPTWTLEYGDRVFYFDAFLSHNRADKSPLLKSRLQEAGLRVWHDSDADLRARKVRVRVNHGLQNSRFVVVCIAGTFVDSPWCRAEYLPALDVGSRAHVQRVLVAQLSPSIIVPAALQSAPVFDCTHQIHPSLLDLLKTANRLTFGPGPVLQAPRTLPATPSLELEALIRQTQDWDWQFEDRGVDPERDARFLTSRFAVMFLTRTAEYDPDPEGQKIQTYCSMLCRIPAETAQRWPSELRQAIFDFAALVARSPDGGDRANALYIFEWLASAGSRPTALDGISEMLRTELDPVMLAEAVKVCKHLRLAVGEIPKEVLQLAFLRGSSRLALDSTLYFRDFLSDAIRLRCALKGDLVDESFLNASEQLLLIEERVAFILKESVYLDLDGIKDRLRVPLGISDLELELRLLRRVMDLFPKVHKDEADQLYERVVNLVHLVAATSEEKHGEPLLAMAEWVLGYALYPLLTCLLAAPATRTVAVETYRQVCSVMKMSDKYSREVPVYLAGLEVALATSNFHQATETIEMGLVRLL
jgi:hypothetical protein